MAYSDIEKHRRTSSYYKMQSNMDTDDYIKDTILDQAIQEFEEYLKYSPTSHKIYVNNNTSFIRGTLQDVSDLEVGTDSKWLLVSIKNNIDVGDVLTIDNKKWLCIYDKEKNTQNCNKYKIQPCQYTIKIPFFKLEDGITPFVYEAPSIISTYLTDMKDFKQPFPTETGTTFVSIGYNDYTKQLKRGDRLWLFDTAFKIGGVDFTNINFYTNKGYYKYTLRPTEESDDLDNRELGICNYYKFFDRANTTVPIVDDGSFRILSEKTSLSTNETITITALNIPIDDKVIYVFDGDNLNCTLTTNNNICTLKTNSSIGIIYVKGYLFNNPSVYSKVRITIK